MTVTAAVTALREALADLMVYHDVPGEPEPVLRQLLAAGYAALAASDPDAPSADVGGDR